MIAPLLDAADEATQEEARKLYASTFQQYLAAEERVEILEAVAKDYSRTRWADDALWVLGEMADGGGDVRSAILFRRQLLERESLPGLEPFTQSRRFYLQSRVPHVLFVLERTGNLYRKRGLQAVSFNPIPMIMCEELALDYERLGLLELALREYQRAITAAPPGGLFGRVYAGRAGRLEGKIRRLASIREAQQVSEAPPAGASVLQEPQPPEDDATAGQRDDPSEPVGSDASED